VCVCVGGCVCVLYVLCVCVCVWMCVWCVCWTEHSIIFLLVTCQKFENLSSVLKLDQYTVVVNSGLLLGVGMLRGFKTSRVRKKRVSVQVINSHIKFKN